MFSFEIPQMANPLRIHYPPTSTPRTAAPAISLPAFSATATFVGPSAVTSTATKRPAREAGITLENNVKRLAEHEILKSGDTGLTFHSVDNTFIIKLIKNEIHGFILINDVIEQEISLNQLCKAFQRIIRVDILKIKSGLFTTTIQDASVIFLQSGTRLVIRFTAENEPLKYALEIYIPDFGDNIKLHIYYGDPLLHRYNSVYKIVNHKDTFNILSLVYILSKEHRNKITSYSLPFIEASYLTAIPFDILDIIFAFSN